MPLRSVGSCLKSEASQIRLIRRITDCHCAHVRGSENVVHGRNDNSCSRVGSSIWSGELTLFFHTGCHPQAFTSKQDNRSAGMNLATSRHWMLPVPLQLRDTVCRVAQQSTRRPSTRMPSGADGRCGLVTHSSDRDTGRLRKTRDVAIVAPKVVRHHLTGTSSVFAIASWLRAWASAVSAVSKEQHARGTAVTAFFDGRDFGEGGQTTVCVVKSGACIRAG